MEKKGKGVKRSSLFAVAWVAKNKVFQHERSSLFWRGMCDEDKII
jgi:hypothetical protein